jgi:L,D-transpeptidase YcbB
MSPIQKKVLIIVSVVAIIVVGLGLAMKNRRGPSREEQLVVVTQSFLDTLRVEAFFRDAYRRDYLVEEFRNFYKDRNFELAWYGVDEPRPQAEKLLNSILQAHTEGLQADDYNPKEMQILQSRLYEGRIKEEDLNRVARLDFFLTAAYLSYASHLSTGRIDPHLLDKSWVARPPRRSLAQYLEKAVDEKRVEESLNELEPAHPQYTLLKEQLAHYQQLAQRGGWKKVEATFKKNVKKGERSPGFAALRERLQITGDLDSTQVAEAEVYDDALEAGLKRFQERHGLTADGKPTAETVEIMNLPVEEYIRLIELNMERTRWLPEDLGEHHLLVNVPEYKLKIFKGGEKTMEMNVVVGKEFNATPIFSDTVEFIVFSPDWTVPQSIASEEMLPKIQANPDFLLTNNYDLYESWDEAAEPVDPHSVKWKEVEPDSFTFRIVQKPGPGNALGSVKFMFPNKMNIYLHDTPAGSLFKRTERAFSHGCIRVEKPADLAEYLLSSKREWDREKIQENMQQEEPVNVLLPEKIPVHIVYRTAWVDEETGQLNFRKDIYEYDKQQYAAIRKKSEQL